MKLALIAAVARNGVIGNGTGMPWHLPEDLAYLKRTTMGAPVLMGRRTWDSLPPRFRPLPGRRNVVVTRDRGLQAPGAEVAHSLDEALARVGEAERVFVLGGGELYAAALPRADELLLTEIERDVEGSVRFPAWPREAFDEVARERHRAGPPNDFDYAFVTYRRREPRSPR